MFVVVVVVVVIVVCFVCFVLLSHLFRGVGGGARQRYYRDASLSMKCKRGSTPPPFLRLGYILSRDVLAFGTHGGCCIESCVWAALLSVRVGYWFVWCCLNFSSPILRFLGTRLLLLYLYFFPPCVSILPHARSISLPRFGFRSLFYSFFSLVVLHVSVVLLYFSVDGGAF